MNINRNGSRGSTVGVAENFTGAVRAEPAFSVGDPVRFRGTHVTFQPGARTNWHTHPRGQTLLVTAGSGLVQKEGGTVRRINPGDVVFFEPGERHWHGACPSIAMTHLAIVEHDDAGKSADWMEPVTDAQYGGAVAAD
jgi:quercetin dioxygenase-like cupin family protein